MHENTFNLPNRHKTNKYNQCNNKMKHNKTYGRKSQHNCNLTINFQRNFHNSTNIGFPCAPVFQQKNLKKTFENHKGSVEAGGGLSQPGPAPQIVP